MLTLLLENLTFDAPMWQKAETDCDESATVAVMGTACVDIM